MTPGWTNIRNGLGESEYPPPPDRKLRGGWLLSYGVSALLWLGVYLLVRAVF
jgi:hypothetical protein